jgi:hypothetical protein
MKRILLGETCCTAIEIGRVATTDPPVIAKPGWHVTFTRGAEVTAAGNVVYPGEV